MKHATVLAFFFAVIMAGCGSTEDSIVKQLNDLNKTTADKVAKAESVSSMKEIMTAFSKKKAATLGRLKTVPQDKRQKLVTDLQTDTQESQERLATALAAFTDRLKGDNNPVVLMETSKGAVKIELFESLAPITVKNFLSYVDNEFYDGTTFHRVIKGFMVQGGGFLAGMKKEKATASAIENESYNGVANNRGMVAMARTSEPNSATAQFFINVVDNGFLNRLENPDNIGYAVFGQVIDGMDVVDAIKVVPTGRDDVPETDMIIKSIRRLKKKS